MCASNKTLHCTLLQAGWNSLFFTEMRNSSRDEFCAGSNSGKLVTGIWTKRLQQIHKSLPRNGNVLLFNLLCNVSLAGLYCTNQGFGIPVSRKSQWRPFEMFYGNVWMNGNHRTNVTATSKGRTHTKEKNSPWTICPAGTILRSPWTISKSVWAQPSEKLEDSARKQWHGKQD